MSATPAGARTTEVSADLMLMMLADARLPVGAYTQSGGLEPALVAGLDPADIPMYCRTRLRTVTATEAATAVVARTVVLSAASTWRSRLDEVQAAWAARTPSDALRDTSRRLARGHLRLARRLWPADPVFAALESGEPLGRACVVGAVAAIRGLSAVQVATLVAYDDVQAVTAAAPKLVPLDPVVATQWALSCYPEIDSLARQVAGITRPEQIPASAAPLIERFAQAHALTRRRLFSA